MTTIKSPRKEVVEFAESMEERLLANDDKGGWKNAGTQYLTRKFLEEVAELLLSYDQDFDDYELVVIFTQMIRRLRKTETRLGSPKHEAADVANIAMMLSDHERNKR